MPLNSALLGIQIQHNNSKTADYTSAIELLNQVISQSFGPGTGAEQSDLVFGPDKRTLAGGANESLDLNGGGLTDIFGNALNFAKVRGLVIQNLSATKTFTIGNDASPFVFLGAGTHTVVLPPNGFLLLVNQETGWTVTAGTGDKLKVANDAGAAADYLIYILGTSA